MSLTAIIDSIDVNSEAGGIVVEGEADFGEAVFTEAGEKKASDGERTTDAERRLRVAVLKLRFEGTSEETRDALYNSVKAALEGTNTDDTTGVLEHNPGGWTANRYLDFYRGVSTIRTTEVVPGHFNFIRRATISLVCKPLARVSALELPENLVVDAAMCDDFAGASIPNSFTLMIYRRAVSVAAADVSVANDTFTSVAHPFVNGDPFIPTTTDTVPAPLVSGTTYYICDKTTDTFKVEASLGGGAIDLTDQGVGTHTITAQTLAYTTDIEDGWAKIVVTAGASGEYVGIEQASIPIVDGDVISSRLEFKCDAATGGVSYSADVYETGGAGTIPFTDLDGRTTAATAQTAEADNRTVSGSTTSVAIRAWISLTADGTGTLWVRMAAIAKAAALPVGADGNSIGWCSLFSETPATCGLTNIPGDVDAQVFMQVVAGESSVATGTEDQLVIGGGPEGTHIISFSGEADADALGGVCSVAEATAGEHIIALDSSLRGRFLVAGRLKVLTSGTPASNTFRLNVYPNAGGRGTPYSTTTISPCAALDKWQGAFFFGTIELPMGGRPEWDWTTAEPQNSLGIECVNLASASWQRDFLALIPLRQGHGRIAGEILAASATKAVLFDTIGDPPGAYFEYEFDSSTVVSVTESGGSHNWFWASPADYTAQIRSVYMPECDDYTSVTPSAGTFVSYDSTWKVARFATGATVTWNVTIVRPASEWWDYENLSTVSNPTEPPDFDPIFIPAGDSVQVPLVAEYVNDADQDFKNVGAKVTLRIVPRYT